MSKSKRARKKDVEFLETVIENNNDAIVSYSGKQKAKRWSQHDLKDVKPLTQTQTILFESWIEGRNPVCIGSAGTGKSFCSIYLALNDILNKASPRNRLIIVRSSTATKDQGFLPGTLEEKSEPIEAVYRDLVNNLIGRSVYDHMKEAGLIEFKTTAYLRGLTWDNAVILLDEIQSLDLHEIYSTITRIGSNTRVICAGDFLQNDLVNHRHIQSGLKDFLTIVRKVPEFEIINFTHDDIVRSKLIKQFIIAYEQTMGSAPV